jgi:predicted aldo/keto reductase-like oxidoreductase
MRTREASTRSSERGRLWTVAHSSTANMYSGGESEVVLGRALKAIGMPRENVVVLTKVCLHSSLFL